MLDSLRSMSPSSRSTCHQRSSAAVRQWYAHLLIFVAMWSLFIKYLFPIAFALHYGDPVLSHVYWDFWPLAHLWLAWALIRLPGYIKELVWGITLAEIVIVSSKFFFFLSEPTWDIWRTNWFINKVFVLLTFLFLLGSLLLQPSLLSHGEDKSHGHE